jgi:hypothetical protein
LYFRYLPEVVAFFQGALQLCVANDYQERFPTMSFPVSQPHRQMLLVGESLASRNDEEWTLLLGEIFLNEHAKQTDGDSKSCTETHFKLAILRTIVGAIREYSEKCSVKYPNAFSAIYRLVYISINYVK